ncbi:hypothetical protein HQ590_06515 [bacterium]|nr:hypothetical protein [bacterium]
MKGLVSSVAGILILALWSAAVAAPTAPDVPKASAGWPMVLLAEPFHIGDQVLEGMNHPRPMGKELARQFDLDTGVLSLYAGVWMTSTVGPGHGGFEHGYYQIKLLINDKQIDVLNRHLPRNRRPGESQKVVVRIDARDLRDGANELVIKGGAKGKNVSECEIHKIVLNVTRP